MNFVSQSDNKMDSYDSDSEYLNELNGDTGVYNNYCITFTSLVKKNFLVVKLYALLRGNHDNEFYCLNCLYSFRTKEKLELHKKCQNKFIV